ncbi:hypothetical protein BOX15_Mlig013486g2, partial [Macrostomum lignano]
WPMDSGQFTEDISRQMRIPDRLGPMADRDYEALHTDTDGGFSRAAQQQPAFLGALDLMSVPDRLLATFEPAPADDFNNTYRSYYSDARADAGGGAKLADPALTIDTPPATITLDKVRYPDFPASDESSLMAAGKKKRRRLSSRQRPASPPSNSIYELDDDATVAPTALAASKLAKLQRRVEALESESRKRRQLEMALYSALGTYLLLKLASWLVASGANR